MECEETTVRMGATRQACRVVGKTAKRFALDGTRAGIRLDRNIITTALDVTK